MSDELQELVNRFLAWKLPTDFYPDCHIHFDREKAEKWGACRDIEDLRNERDLPFEVYTAQAALEKTA